MMNINKSKMLFSILCSILMSVAVYSQKIQVNPSNWNIDLTGEIMEAGNDFIGSYTSSANQLDIRIFNIGNNTTWTVYVKYESTNIVWDNSIKILVQRTGNGTIPSGQGIRDPFLEGI